MLTRTRAQRVKLAQARREERRRIVRFLETVFAASTHGASSLMERSIAAVKINDLCDPVRVADPIRPGRLICRKCLWPSS